MRAAVLREVGAPLQLEDVELDDPKAGEVRVRIEAAGVCHSDLHAVRAHRGGDAPALVPGHEFTGVVTETGPDVTGFAAGDRVIGYSGWGAAREKIAVGTGKLIKMPAGLAADAVQVVKLPRKPTAAEARLAGAAIAGFNGSVALTVLAGGQARVAEIARPGDIVMTLSCGDVYRILPSVREAILAAAGDAGDAPEPAEEPVR